MKAPKDFFPSKRWQRRHNKILKPLIGGVILILILVVLNLFVSPIKNSFYAVSSPIQKTFWTAGESSSSFFSSIMKAGFLARQNEELKSQNQELLSQLAFLQSIEQGNEAQSAGSEACQNNGFEYIMAGVIGLDANDILSINKGSVDGIVIGMPVINQQNTLFGKVLKVYKNFSEIMLVSNKNSIVNVEVRQINDGLVDETGGVLKGIGGLGAYLDLIPISSEINPGGILVTSAIEKSFPKDLLVGKITQVQRDDQKPFQQAQVNLFFDVKTADNLFVITNYKRAD